MEIKNHIKSVQSCDKVGAHTILCGVPGVELFVSKTAKGLTKRFKLRYQKNGSQVRQTLGVFEVDMNLKQAIEKAMELLTKKNIDDQDPQDEYRKRSLGTFKEFATKMLTAELEVATKNFNNKIFDGDFRKLKTVEAYIRALVDTEPINDIPILEVKPHQVNNVIQGFKARGMKGSAKTTRTVIRQVYEHLGETTEFDHFPIENSSKVIDKKKGDAKSGQVALRASDIKQIWRATESSRADLRHAIRFQLLTGARVANVESMRWEEVVGSKWTIPAYKFKGNRDHVVRLTKAARSILKEQHKGNRSVYVFPKTTKVGYIEHDLNRELKRLGATFTSHAFRKTVPTIMKALGISFEIRETCIGHMTENQLSKLYTTDFIDDLGVIENTTEDRVAEAFQKYSDLIEKYAQM